MSADTDRLWSALGAAQAEFGEVKKTRKMMVRNEVRYHYANLSDVVEAVMPALKKHGFFCPHICRGNRLHGYASQGALVDKVTRFYREKDQEAEGEDDTASEAELQVTEALQPKQVNPKAPGAPVTKVEKKLAKGFVVPILKAVANKQIVYGVILAPNEIDAQDDFMDPDEIEKAAHRYLTKSRVIGSGHTKPIDATPVESFIAPQDLELSGQYGPQVVKKGSWILGVKVNDPEEWKKILSGEYTGFSVGGMGLREQT
jgi:hypothetical protein